MKKLAIIIGGSSGVGYAICDKLSKNNEYIVINMSRRKSELLEIDNIYIDVTNKKIVDNAFKQLKDKYKDLNLTLMVYCAGYVEPQFLLEIDEYNLMKTIETNLCGAFYCTQNFVELSKDNNDNKKIIYISSTAGIRASPKLSVYGASKAALINFSYSMNEELKEYNIKTYCLSPGRFASYLRKKIAPNEDQSKIMRPSEIADFLYDLINNDYGQLINNQNIVIKR